MKTYSYIVEIPLLVLHSIIPRNSIFFLVTTAKTHNEMIGSRSIDVCISLPKFLFPNHMRVSIYTVYLFLLSILTLEHKLGGD